MPLKVSRIDTDMKSMPKAKAGFIEPMLLLRTEALPEGAEWIYELKLDGYRALGVKANGQVQLRSGNDNDFSSRYPAIVSALASLPDETVIDGEVVAIDESGRPSFKHPPKLRFLQGADPVLCLRCAGPGRPGT